MALLNKQALRLPGAALPKRLSLAARPRVIGVGARRSLVVQNSAASEVLSVAARDSSPLLQSASLGSFELQQELLQQHVALFQVSEGLETPIQLIYLLTLLAFLAAGAFLVVRQVLIRRELDEAAKQLGERIRTNEASCEDYFELGVILTRKRLYTQATKNLEKAKKVWDGEESELAQVHNALGFCYLQMEKVEDSVQEFRRAVDLQPGYVTAWNNLGDAYERTKSWRNALSAYQEALTYAPNNTIARQRCDFCKSRCENLGIN